MAVISELIDAGLQLKSQGKHEAAIEHFRQLLETYPGNARIKFELAATWSAFGVPEQALPLYRELLALPKRKGLAAKDMPRLYVRLAATLYALQEFEGALNILDEGLRLHPSYRPLRAFRIFNQHGAGRSGMALLDALDLMLDSLAPSRWDIFEDDVKGIIGELRQSVIEAEKLRTVNVPDALDAAATKHATPDDTNALMDDAEAQADDQQTGHGGSAALEKIDVTAAADEIDDFDLEVRVLSSKKKSEKKQGKPRKSRQSSESKVRINISGSDEDDGEVEGNGDEDQSANDSGKVNIPIDID